MSIENHEVESLRKGDQSLEDFITEHLARNLGIDPSEITLESLFALEHAVEFDLRPNPADLAVPAFCKFVTRREELTRRGDVVALVNERNASAHPNVSPNTHSLERHRELGCITFRRFW